MTKYEPFKLKPQGDWHSRPRTERLGNILYAHLSDPETKATMGRIAGLEGKGKQQGMADRVNGPKVRDPWQLRKEYQR
jgi:hypothetical protein